MRLATKKMFMGVELTGDAAEVRSRQKIEIEIAAKVIDAALEHGYYIDVDDGEETVLASSKSKPKILAAMFTTDEDRLYLGRRNDDGSNDTGWVYFVYGNDGIDVISDYTTNLETILGPISQWIDDTF